MARSDYTTPDLLTEWRRYSDQNAWKFNQIGTGEPVPADKYDVWIQSERDIISRGLQSAYATMTERLRYTVKPDYQVNEFVHIPDRACLLSQQTLFTEFAHLIEFGTRAITLIEAGATIVYSDADGDGVDDTATVTVTTSHDADEVQVFFKVADGAYSAANEKWQIPATVTKSGTTATIVFNRFDCVQPSIWSAPYNAPNYRNDARNMANTGDVLDFITEVDVYRVYSDSTDAVNVITFTGTNGAPEETAVTATVLDGETGAFRVTGTGTAQRGLLKASYKAGYALQENRLMDTELAQATVRLANVNMALVPQSTSKENLVNRVWLNDREERGDFEDRIAYGMAYTNEVVSRRKHYIGGYSS